MKKNVKKRTCKIFILSVRKDFFIFHEIDDHQHPSDSYHIVKLISNLHAFSSRKWQKSHFFLPTQSHGTTRQTQSFHFKELDDSSKLFVTYIYFWRTFFHENQYIWISHIQWNKETMYWYKVLFTFFDDENVTQCIAQTCLHTLCVGLDLTKLIPGCVSTINTWRSTLNCLFFTQICAWKYEISEMNYFNCHFNHFQLFREQNHLSFLMMIIISTYF